MQYRLLTRNFARQVALFLILTLTVSSLTAFAQDKQDKNDNKKKAPKVQKEALKSVYKRWKDEDVRWIITDEERKTFDALKTDDEREQFIEQFWLRRDPDPDTDANEYREEYYQRIAYANENFTSGIPGWKTDRGRIYIMFGAPHQKESHPSGGSYNRPVWEGGGSTSTYPFEIWWYRYLEGVGSDIEIEFVDPTGSGEYRIARNPNEKDALLYTPNAGLTLAEELGLSSKADRIAYGGIGGIGGGNGNGNQLFGTRAKDQPFERLDLLAKLQRAPKVKFNDLAALASESDLPKPSFDVLSAAMNVHLLRVTENAVLASFAVQLDNSDLVYKEIGGLPQAAINIYAKITNVAGRRAGQFEDVVTSSYTPEALEFGMQQKSAYEKNVVLPPGNYKIDLVVRDVNSGKTGVIKQGFVVPRYEEGKLSTSTLVIASKIEPLAGRLPSGQHVRGSLKVIPNATGEFKQDQMLGLYMQVYNVAIDQATLRPSVDIEYVITQRDKEVMRIKEDGKNGMSSTTSQQITLARQVPLKDLKPGFYDIQVFIKDNVAGATVITDKDTFHIK
ncbi:MAG TPA: GWxTD domain-containing protein [Blastocatellia bacterium]|nr:GWxTD domain-containing protein [Blastocatellia bacterium]HMV87399.1 GWxTD domain-containing protein [Blastocatellia bacterium]HMX27150.1 GWxTD domain-containing protein [Blastocatellia bacterium]HMY73029.1 GWxTD domain-containing protein [Blastocatellia bacterium]HMZ16634.1 GWxTD domain-containing protein [Blastocatellia bacterium]